MAEVTNELIYEVLKGLQSDMSSIRSDMGEIKTELVSVRGHIVSMQIDIHNIYSKLIRHEDQLARIERRLELRELSEPQLPFDS